MIKIVQTPTSIKAAGDIPKKIDEFFGRLNSGTDEISIARMNSPAGWEEPGQTPDFDEYTIVITGTLKVETRKDIFYVHAGQAIMVGKGEWVKYSSPEAYGAQYVAVCLPAFSPDSVNRD